MSTAELLRIAEPRNGAEVARLLTSRRDASSVSAMLDAARGTEPDARLAAFRALGAQRHTGLLGEVVDLLDGVLPVPPRARGAVLRYLEALPADTTLPIARQRIDRGGFAATAAEHLLARHARAEDRALVEATLAR
ncbi:MAG: hypothetical protein KC586_18535, partial [Myxococcales bacterium]|nr:hypothetical protein [Myxococcales bacterium]